MDKFLFEIQIDLFLLVLIEGFFEVFIDSALHHLLNFFVQHLAESLALLGKI
jgi:hypothetical protein